MKRSIGIGFAAILAVAAIAPAAVSQGRAPRLDAKNVAKGKAEAPAVAQAVNLTCDIANAYYLGGGTDAKTKVKTDAYEVACAQGMGFVLVASSAAATQVVTCLQTSAPGSDGKVSNLACKLPENQEQTKALQPYVTKAGATCDIEKARAIGGTATNAYFEVACAGGKGYIMATSNAPTPEKDVTMTTCLAYEAGATLACTLSDQAVQLAAVDALATSAGKNCAVKDKRYVLSSKDGSNYYEVACQDGKGYMLQETAAGALARSIDCAAADFVGGGCKLTDSRAAATEQNGLYTRLAKAAGFNCDVAKYGPLNGQPGIDTVELQCSNRPDGAIALFGRDAASTKIYDCVQSEIAGYRCSFTKYDPLYPKLTDNLKSLGKTSCSVSNARIIGASDKEGFVEVACSDGLPGWVISLDKADMKPKEALSCSQAKGIGGGCKLPTNVRA